MNDIILNDPELQKIKEELLKAYTNFNKNISYMAADAPIEILGLPATIQTILVNEGCLRVYDLLNRDLTKIKGIGKRRIGDLTSRLNEFLSMS